MQATRLTTSPKLIKTAPLIAPENPVGKAIAFTIKAPGAKSVSVAGTFNDWDPNRNPLKKEARGWKTQIWLTPGRHEYRFVVDGEWLDDPNATERIPNSLGSSNCVLNV